MAEITYYWIARGNDILARLSRTKYVDPVTFEVYDPSPFPEVDDPGLDADMDVNAVGLDVPHARRKQRQEPT